MPAFPDLANNSPCHARPCLHLIPPFQKLPSLLPCPTPSRSATPRHACHAAPHRYTTGHACQTAPLRSLPVQNKPRLPCLTLPCSVPAVPAVYGPLHACRAYPHRAPPFPFHACPCLPWSLPLRSKPTSHAGPRHCLPCLNVTQCQSLALHSFSRSLRGYNLEQAKPASGTSLKVCLLQYLRKSTTANQVNYSTVLNSMSKRMRIDCLYIGRERTSTTCISQLCRCRSYRKPEQVECHLLIIGFSFRG